MIYGGNNDSSSTIDSLKAEDALLLSPQGFINEINYNDLSFLEEVGRGAYGSVYKALWRNRIVATKIPENLNNTKEFRDEARRLSSVRHKNIIQLYGTSANGPRVCLVMEFADCGSLHTFLHAPQQEAIPYTFAHVMRWSLQCTEAVEYLHNNKPKAIIHRDLKPPNMLLTNCGNVLKICDFGTACHPHTEMSVNRGSTQWMAPEVFDGTRYAEKCDVYSFGIVLWEMLTRRKPFDGIDTYRIMWTVHQGERPPPIQRIPNCLQNIMQKCWDKEDSVRPSFTQLVKFFKRANQFVTGWDEPLVKHSDLPSNEPLHCSDNSEVQTSVFCADEYIRERVNLHENSFEQWEEPVGDDKDKTSSRQDVADAQFGFRRISSSSLRERVNPPSIDLSPVLPSTGHPDHINRAVSAPVISEHYRPQAPKHNTSDIFFHSQQWTLVPQDLMPILAIRDDPLSEKMYMNYMEALKKYISIQEKVENLKQRKEVLLKNIEQFETEQKRDSRYMAEFLLLQTEKQNLLDLHGTIKPLIEREKAKRDFQAFLN